jgi:hypothetical protein
MSVPIRRYVPTLLSQAPTRCPQTTPTWGFIDARGKTLIEPSYDMVAPTHFGRHHVRDGKTFVLMDGWWLEIDSSGRELAELGKSAVPRPK